jgi:hypothetical protein
MERNGEAASRTAAKDAGGFQNRFGLEWNKDPLATV